MARSEATVEVATSGCQRAPETEAKPVVEKHLWHCRLCSYSFEMVERQSTFKKKRAHMKKCHPDADPSDTSYRTTLPLIEVADLPWEDRCWSCSKCLLGLANGLPCSQRERSTAAHLEKCTKISAKENLAKLKELKLDGFRKNNRNQTGWHNVTWRQKRLQETASKGHDVRFVGENETGVGKDEARIRYTCRICKRLTNNTNYFVTSTCAPRDYVRGSHWLDLRLKQPDTVLKVVQAWGWNQEKILEQQKRAENPPKKGTYQRPDLPPLQESVWWPDLTTQGIEPNPGPARQTIRGVSLNTGVATNTLASF